MKKRIHILSAILISGLVLFGSCIHTHAHSSKLRDPIIEKDTVRQAVSQDSAAVKK